MTFEMYSLWKGRLSVHESLTRRVRAYARVETPTDWRTPLRREGRCQSKPWLAVEMTGESEPIVALGKFDAMHLGHRALAIGASRLGHPWLISFHGMAEVMGCVHSHPNERTAIQMGSESIAIGGRP